MHKEIHKRLSTGCSPLIGAVLVVGLCVHGSWGCSNSDSQKSGTEEQDDGGGKSRANTQEDNLKDDVTECSQCASYEVCVDDKCLCEPSCDGKSVKDDGCGGQCACAEGTVANEHFNCVEPTECAGSCDIAGWECGEICGVSCGECGANHRCESGYCECEAVCDGTRCDDGCGGVCPCADGTVCNLENECVPPGECDDTCDIAEYSCGSICGEACGTCAETESCIDHACETAVNCEDCSLKLFVVDKAVSDNRLKSVTLAVDYAPFENETKPRIFDIRLKVDDGVELTSLTVGDALLTAEKDLYTDPNTQNKWQERADGTYRFVAFSVSDNREIEKGRLMVLDFTTDMDSAALFSIVKKVQTFAPPLADEALQSSRYGETIQVTQ